MRPTLLPACVLFLLVANVLHSQPPAGAKKKDRTFILDYRVYLDAGSPSSFLVKDAAPKIKRADLKSDAADAERAAFAQLLDAIEKLQVNGVLFTATGELEKGELRLKGLPTLTQQGRLRILDATKGKGIAPLVPVHPLSLAVEAVKQIPGAKEKAVAFTEIASAYCDEANRSENKLATLAFAKHLLENALAEAQQMPVTSFDEGREFIDTVGLVALWIGRSGQLELARHVIDHGFIRRVEAERKFAQHEYSRENALRFLLNQQLSRGMENEARATQRALAHPHMIQEAALSFTRHAAKRNDLTQALKEVEDMLKDDENKITVYNAIGEGLIDGGHLKEAKPYLDKVRDEITVMAKDPKKKDSAGWDLTRLSQRYSQAKQYDIALKLLDPLKSDNKYLMLFRQTYLAEINAEKGDLEKARLHGHKARAMHKGNEYALVLVANQISDAKKFDEAWKAIEDIEDDHFRFNAILHLAKVLDREGRKEDAKDNCRLCLKIIEKMPEEKGFGGTSPRASMFATLAEAHAAIDEAGARAWIEKEFAPQSQAWAWIGVARAWNARLKTSP